MGRGDVALAATVPGMVIHAPATACETEAVIRAAVADVGLHPVRLWEQTDAHELPSDGRMHLLRQAAAVAAAAEPDAMVLASTTVRALDGATLRAYAGQQVVQPWLEGTSLGAVAELLDDAPRRYLP